MIVSDRSNGEFVDIGIFEESRSVLGQSAEPRRFVVIDADLQGGVNVGVSTGPQEIGSVGVEDVLAENHGVGLVPAPEPAEDVAASPARRQVAVLSALPQFALVTHSTLEASVAGALARR